MAQTESPARLIARNVLVVVGVLLILYLIYLLRRPISWLIIAAFLAIALAGPVNFFQRYMKRGLAIFLVYLGLLAIPIGLGAVLIPPIVNQISDVATNAPSYVNDVEDYVNKNKTLNDLNEKYDITQKLSDEANQLPSKAGDAAKVLRDIGFGLVSSIFAGVSILILSIFMVAAGPRWIEGFIRMQRPEHAERIERTLRRIANAVGNYVGGALLQATIAGLAAFIMLTILGVPFAGPAGGGDLRLRPDPGHRRHDRGRARRDRHRVRQLPDRPDHLGGLRDRLPAGRELPDPAADPEAGDQDRGLHRPGRRALRQHPVRDPRRDPRDPGRRLDPDRRDEYREYRREVLAAEQEAGGPTPAPPPEGPTPAPEAT